MSGIETADVFLLILLFLTEVPFHIEINYLYPIVLSFNDIRYRGEESLFLSQFDDSMTQLYSIKECSLGLGVSDSSGFLFLPGLDQVVDFNQCMYTQSREGLSWLKKVFGYLKTQAQIFTP